MSSIYWGIVFSLFAMVAILLLCIQLVSRSTTESGSGEGGSREHDSRKDLTAEGPTHGSKQAA
jgi:hypothetical protein